MYLVIIWGGTKWFWGGTIHNEGEGLKNRDFFGPLNGTSVASAIWAKKVEISNTKTARSYCK